MTTFTSFSELGKHLKEPLLTQTVAYHEDNQCVQHYIIQCLKDKPRDLDEIVNYTISHGFSKTTVEIAVHKMHNDAILHASSTNPSLCVYWLAIPYGQLFHNMPYKPYMGNAPRKYKDSEALTEPNDNGTITKHDTVSVAIGKVLQDYKPRSALEIINILKAFNFNALHVSQCLEALAKPEGSVEAIEGKGKKMLYVLKKTQVDSSEKTQDSQDCLEVPNAIEDLKGTVFYQGKPDGETPEALPEPVIPEKHFTVKSSDLLIVVLWKLMRDRKWYCWEDLRILHEASGHPTMESSFRCIISKATGLNWLDTYVETNGEGENRYKTRYWRMKERVLHPTGGRPMEETIEPDEPITTQQEAQIKEQSQVSSENESVARANIVTRSPYTFYRQDSIAMIIFKLMTFKTGKEFKWFSFKNIVGVFADLNFSHTLSSIEAEFTMLCATGWFDTREASKEEQKTGFTDKLFRLANENVHSPGTSFLMSELVAAQESNPPNVFAGPYVGPYGWSGAQSNPTNSQENQPSSSSEQTFHDGNLLEIDIKIKGVSFNIDELNEVLQFAASHVSSKPSLMIQSSFKIKGVDFTETDLMKILTFYQNYFQKLRYFTMKQGGFARV